MLDRWNALLAKPWVLLTLLVFQCIMYWMIEIYMGSAAVPVAYQKF